jgi:hypothetical protein
MAVPLQKPFWPTSMTTACANFGAVGAPPTIAMAGVISDKTIDAVNARVIAM